MNRLNVLTKYSTNLTVSFITGIWMAVVGDWPNLLVSRFALGLAVGAKSSTTPVYGAVGPICYIHLSSILKIFTGMQSSPDTRCISHDVAK